MQNINLAAGYHNIPNFHQLNLSLTEGLNDAEYHIPSPFQGLEGFREAIAAKLYLENGVRGLEKENVLITQGATQALYLIMTNMLEPGDEVILPMPAWGYFRELANSLGLKVKRINTTPENQFKLTAEELFHAATPETKMLFLTNPGNPGGGIYTQEELQNLARVIRLHPQMIVLADEVYELLVFNEERPFIPLSSFLDIKDQIVTVNGFSKSFGLTSWRIAYLYSHNEDIVNRLTGAQRISTYGLPLVTQRLAWTALQKEQLYKVIWQRVGKPRRDELYSFFAQYPNLEVYKPDGAYFLFPDLEEICLAAGFDHSAQFPIFLDEKYNLEVADGADFGMPFHYRFNFMQTQGIITEVTNRLDAAFDELSKRLF